LKERGEPRLGRKAIRRTGDVYAGKRGSLNGKPNWPFSRFRPLFVRIDGGRTRHS
jgi:hypothetical protein